jgi:prepilin-type N-terminal cleavage/methylation domain-containing protein
MNKKGFTIVELLIAISVFSMAIMLVTAVVLGIARQYQKASYTVQLNDASRNIHEMLAKDSNYGNSSPVTFSLNGKTWVCSNGVMYAWPNTAGGAIGNGLFRYEPLPTQRCDDTSGSEPTATAAISNGVNLLPKNGFVANFSIDNTIGGGASRIETSFRVGTADMFTESDNPAGSNCLPTLKGGDFCAVVQYNSVVRPHI